MLVDLQDLPGEVERTVTKLDKTYEEKSKRAQSKGGSQEQLMKNLLLRKFGG